MPVVRITQFKIPEPQDVDKAIEAYKVLESTALKDGKKYMVINAYKLHPDPRSQGYTFAAQSSFMTLEDMKFYDEECGAHGVLKDAVKPLVAGEPPLTIYSVIE